MDQNDPLTLRSCLSPRSLCLHSVVPETNPSLCFLLLSLGLVHIDKNFKILLQVSLLCFKSVNKQRIYMEFLGKHRNLAVGINCHS